MREKLKQLDETFLDLMVGVFLCGVAFAILGMIITKGDFWYLLGCVVGIIAAAAMFTHMTVTIKKSVELEPGRAKKYMTRCVIVRYVGMLVVMFICIHINFVCFLGVVIGCLGSKMSALFHDMIHEHITRKILGL